MSQSRLQGVQEPWTIATVKSLVLMVAGLLFSLPLTGFSAVLCSVVGCALGAGLAYPAQRAGFRNGIALGMSGSVFLIALVVTWTLRQWQGLLWWVDGRDALLTAECLLFGFVAISACFALRFLSARSRTFAAVEVGVVLWAVTLLFARHRNLAIHRPRFLSDWALSHGYDPTMLLQAAGIVTAGIAILMTLRHQRWLKLSLTLGLLSILGAIIFSGLKDTPQPVPEQDWTADGLTTPQGSGGDGQSPPPIPVALALFHDDHEPLNGLLYFRQQVLSRFDGRRLVNDPRKLFDNDVLMDFPHEKAITAETEPSGFHLRLNTSMFLLADHPQPLALTASTQVSPLENPAPRRFVATYNATSRVMSTPLHRMVGRRSIPETWDETKKAHYLEHPDDPRYTALAEEIVREGDPRFAGDDLSRAFAIKRFLETNGFYTRKERHSTMSDPTASFLFGNLRGYCVHFAHSAVHLLRSQGIAARVAVGYLVDNQLRGPGSAVIITGDRAHAWPEIHLDGVGWTPFDIYPEQSDEPPPQFVDQSLESLLGELARNDPTGGRSAEPLAKSLDIPWQTLLEGLALLIWCFLVLSYGIKMTRQISPVFKPTAHQIQFRAVLDRFSDLGLRRVYGESRESYAVRVTAMTPSFERLTQIHLKLTLGRPQADDAATLALLSRQVLKEYVENIPRWKRVMGWLNPWGWWFTR